MAKTIKKSMPSTTIERIKRLHKLLKLLAGKKGKSRGELITKLGLDERGFYRDVKFLRERGILVSTEAELYKIDESIEDAWKKLPCPDPMLSMEEAMLLAEGSSEVHKKLKKMISTV